MKDELELSVEEQNLVARTVYQTTKWIGSTVLTSETSKYPSEEAKRGTGGSKA